MNRNQALLNGHLGPRANAAQMVRVTERQNAAAVLFGARNTQLHGLMTNRLTKATFAVQTDHGTVVHPCLNFGIRLEATFQIRLGIARQNPHAMRIVTSQVGLYQIFRDEFDFSIIAAETFHQIPHCSSQAVDGDEMHLSHSRISFGVSINA